MVFAEQILFMHSAGFMLCLCRTSGKCKVMPCIVKCVAHAHDHITCPGNKKIYVQRPCQRCLVNKTGTARHMHTLSTCTCTICMRVHTLSACTCMYTRTSPGMYCLLHTGSSSLFSTLPYDRLHAAAATTMKSAAAGLGSTAVHMQHQQTQNMQMLLCTILADRLCHSIQNTRSACCALTSSTCSNTVTAWPLPPPYPCAP